MISLEGSQYEKKKGMYKDGFAPRKNGGNEIRDPRINLA